MAAGDEPEAGAEGDRRARRDGPKGEAQDGPNHHPTGAQRREDRTESPQAIAARARSRSEGPLCRRRSPKGAAQDGPRDGRGPEPRVTIRQQRSGWRIGPHRRSRWRGQSPEGRRPEPGRPLMASRPTLPRSRPAEHTRSGMAAVDGGEGGRYGPTVPSRRLRMLPARAEGASTGRGPSIGHVLPTKKAVPPRSRTQHMATRSLLSSPA